MGLDWNPLARAKPGHEAEFATIVEQVIASDDRENREDHEELAARFHQLSEPAHQTLGAPRVGIDPSADEWLRGRVEPDKYDEARVAMHGYYVLDLLPPCDGFPLYSNYGMYEQIDRYTFRAQFLNDVQDIIGDELHGRAFERMSAAQLGEYGETLLAHARRFATARGVTHVEAMRDRGEQFSEDESRAHILFAAGKWCVYWARRGHGLDPWY